MNIVFMSLDTLPSTLWARDLYDQMHIRSDFRKWFPRMCQYGFIEGRDYEYMPRVRLQDEGGRSVQRYVKDYRCTQDMAKKLCKLHHTAVGVAFPIRWLQLRRSPKSTAAEPRCSIGCCICTVFSTVPTVSGCCTRNITVRAIRPA